MSKFWFLLLLSTNFTIFFVVCNISNNDSLKIEKYELQKFLIEIADNIKNIVDTGLVVYEKLDEYLLSTSNGNNEIDEFYSIYKMTLNSTYIVIDSLQTFLESLNSSLNINEKEMFLQKIKMKLIQIQFTAVNSPIYFWKKEYSLINEESYSVELGNLLKADMQQIVDAANKIVDISRRKDLDLIENCKIFLNFILSHTRQQLIPTLNELYQIKTSEISSAIKKKLRH
ncbi:uncharacterized protein LOC127287274 [Leptopilina boulardi]|uniref:uncharacterized protein LOC127287274 n=1 Tax=Leptopilina boulardi TaxID=63433 RepID=UPI0021F5A631|nr:uncharacterized protein LOC127287274 [Leptopilina boulardi]